MTAPEHALAGWNRIEAEIRGARRVAFFSDFDGTLARIRRHPGHVVLPERVRILFAAVARAAGLAGIVSGRGIADLRRRAGVRHIWYAGAHGFFLVTPDNRMISLLSRGERKRMSEVHRSLARRLRGLRGIHLEPKDATIAVHYRAASARSAARARRLTVAVLEEHPGVSLMAGKKMWELLPNSHIDKWTAITFILRRARQRSNGRLRLPIFLGDDVTDERVFQKMEGISIAVGKKHRTAARFYLRSPAEVARFLEQVRRALS